MEICVIDPLSPVFLFPMVLPSFFPSSFSNSCLTFFMRKNETKHTKLSSQFWLMRFPAKKSLIHKFIHQCPNSLCNIQSFPTYGHHLIFCPVIFLFYCTPLCPSSPCAWYSLPFLIQPLGSAHTERFLKLFQLFFPLIISSTDPINLFYISLTTFASVFFVICVSLSLNGL